LDAKGLIGCEIRYIIREKNGLARVTGTAELRRVKWGEDSFDGTGTGEMMLTASSTEVSLNVDSDPNCPLSVGWREGTGWQGGAEWDCMARKNKTISWRPHR